MSKRSFFIYKITNLINQKVYIGQTVSPKKRWTQHKCVSKTNFTFYLYKAIRKYGIDNFSFEVVAQIINDEDTDLVEIECIKQYNSNNHNFGYNIENGGKGRGRVSEETKDKLSKFHIGLKLSENSKRKISASSTGKKHSEETKLKMRKKIKTQKKKLDIIYPSLTGKRLSEETKKKLSEINTGKKASEETKAKMSQSMIGKNKADKNGMFGVSSEKAPCAKLTLLQAIEIRKEYNLGKISSIALAKKYNVSKKTILNILHNKTYIEPNK